MRVSFDQATPPNSATPWTKHIQTTTESGNYFYSSGAYVSFLETIFWTVWIFTTGYLGDQTRGCHAATFPRYVLHNEPLGSKVQFGHPPGWLLWKSLAFPRWGTVFSSGAFIAKVKAVAAIGCSREGPPQTLL